MKNRITLMLVGALTLGSLAFADIQAPPGAKWNWSRKLSRSLANLAYGVTEYPTTWSKVERQDGVNAAATSMVVEGTSRTLVRVAMASSNWSPSPSRPTKAATSPLTTRTSVSTHGTAMRNSPLSSASPPKPATAARRATKLSV
ncbi:hypothetical protein [Verrucomicrobium spinosum]|uniref:hypothetical protein n=1 Tax=Verrucomicrobium spinosum TaxID=2736 RepID=UPI0009462CFB|nr:hypothetical protein [Verrucomicrobium spinosum]